MFNFQPLMGGDTALYLHRQPLVTYCIQLPHQLLLKTANHGNEENHLYLGICIKITQFNLFVYGKLSKILRWNIMSFITAPIRYFYSLNKVNFFVIFGLLIVVLKVVLKTTPIIQKNSYLHKSSAHASSLDLETQYRKRFNLVEGSPNLVKECTLGIYINEFV